MLASSLLQTNMPCGLIGSGNQGSSRPQRCECLRVVGRASTAVRTWRVLRSRGSAKGTVSVVTRAATRLPEEIAGFAAAVSGVANQGHLRDDGVVELRLQQRYNAMRPPGAPIVQQ